jgi:hypothetical protein
MELEELKKQLNQRMETRGEHSPADLAALLKKDAQSVIQKINRSLLIEISLTVLFTIGCGLAVIFLEQWSYVAFFTVFGVIGALVSLALGYLVSKIKRLNNGMLTARKNVETINSIIRQYVRLYVRLGMALLPFSFGIALWLSYNDPTVVHKPIAWGTLLYLVAGLILFGYASYRFTRWYLQKQYSNYVDELRDLLREFDGE